MRNEIYFVYIDFYWELKYWEKECLVFICVGEEWGSRNGGMFFEVKFYLFKWFELFFFVFCD